MKSKQEYIDELNEVLEIEDNEIDLSKLSKEELILLKGKLENLVRRAIEHGRTTVKDDVVGAVKGVVEVWDGPIFRVIKKFSKVTDEDEEND